MNCNCIPLKQPHPEFDFIRILAASLVVLLHVTALLESVSFSSADILRFNQILNSSCFIAVPLFVMLSGALLLGHHRHESLVDFYKKRFRRLFFPVLIWSIMYLIIASLQNDLTWKNILFMVLRGKPFYHLWYLYMLMGLYLLTPAFRRLFSECNLKEKVWWTSLILLMVWLNDATDYILGMHRNGSPCLFFNLSIPFIGLFLCGSVLRELTERKQISKVALSGVVLVSIITLTIIAYSGGKQWNSFVISYRSPVNNVAAISCFYCFLCTCNKFAWNKLSVIGRSTLGVYLVHPLLLLILAPLFGSTIGWCGYFTLLIVTLLMSFLTALVGLHIYGLRKIF